MSGGLVVTASSVLPNPSMPTYSPSSGPTGSRYWCTTASASAYQAGYRTASASLPSQAGQTRLLIVSFPLDAVITAPHFDPAAAGAEYLHHRPGLAELFGHAHPGMHTTDMHWCKRYLDHMDAKQKNGSIATPFEASNQALVSTGVCWVVVVVADQQRAVFASLYKLR